MAYRVRRLPGQITAFGTPGRPNVRKAQTPGANPQPAVEDLAGEYDSEAESVHLTWKLAGPFGPAHHPASYVRHAIRVQRNGAEIGILPPTSEEYMDEEPGGNPVYGVGGVGDEIGVADAQADVAVMTASTPVVRPGRPPPDLPALVCPTVLTVHGATADYATGEWVVIIAADGNAAGATSYIWRRDGAIVAETSDAIYADRIAPGTYAWSMMPVGPPCPTLSVQQEFGDLPPVTNILTGIVLSEGFFMGASFHWIQLRAASGSTEDLSAINDDPGASLVVRLLDRGSGSVLFAPTDGLYSVFYVGLAVYGGEVDAVLAAGAYTVYAELIITGSVYAGAYQSNDYAFTITVPTEPPAFMDRIIGFGGDPLSNVMINLANPDAGHALESVAITARVDGVDTTTVATGRASNSSSLTFFGVRIVGRVATSDLLRVGQNLHVTFTVQGTNSVGAGPPSTVSTAGNPFGESFRIEYDPGAGAPPAFQFA